MGLYSPGRRRAILLLLLTSALLLTLDQRGSSLLDNGRSLFSSALRPLESAAEVVTRPIENAWRGITDYEDLERRYDELSANYEAMRADNFVARAVIAQNRELRAVLNLSSPDDHNLTTAYVVGEQPTNVDQVIQIDKGSNDNICFGMPVLASNWLIGRVVKVDSDRAWVRLITDSRYGVNAKVMRPEAIDPEQLPVVLPTTAPPVTEGTLPPEATPPPDSAPPAEAVASEPPADSQPLDTTTTTTLPPPPPIRSTGLFQGRGGDRLPVVVFQDGLPSDEMPQVGDVVFTTGGELSLVPVDVPIGVVASSTRGSTSEGLITEVQPGVQLDNLEFVSVMLYVSQQEAGQCSAIPAG